MMMKRMAEWKKMKRMAYKRITEDAKMRDLSWIYHIERLWQGSYTIEEIVL